MPITCCLIRIVVVAFNHFSFHHICNVATIKVILGKCFALPCDALPASCANSSRNNVFWKQIMTIHGFAIELFWKYFCVFSIYVFITIIRLQMTMFWRNYCFLCCCQTIYCKTTCYAITFFQIFMLFLM